MTRLPAFLALCFVVAWNSMAGASDIRSAIIADWMHQDAKTGEADPDYVDRAMKRRGIRLKTLKELYPKIVFTKHFDLGGSHYAYTEAQSDAQAERHFVPGSALCLLELGEDGEYHERTLISDPNGVIRDPAVTFDGQKILFAWKKSDRLDDYHLYDYDVEKGKIRQLTFGLGYADYEPCPLPNGDIIFNSTRCVQVVDCWLTEVSNIYRCDQGGHFLRRLSFDQVHTNYPALMDDGRVIYTRWDYNDRGQIFPQGVFQMNADGTGQTEFYGNNSWFPTTVMHARSIPNSGGKVISIFSGHHNRQYGKLGVIDTTRGRQENSGTQLVAPIRETTDDRIDAWGQWGDRFSHPYPISENEFLVAYNHEFPEPENPIHTEGERRTVADQHTVRTPFGIYWMNSDGERELLVRDEKISCNQPFPLAARPAVPIRDSIPDVENEMGTFSVQDVYFGPGMEGVERGTAKTLRVIALDFRSTGIGKNSNGGPAGGAMVSTPISISQGTWDVKIPLGDTPIHEDGSASFTVPARMPVYFQILDENGHCIQTMRSWATLQPGENFACLGCHEDKNLTARPDKLSMALRKGPQPLKPFYGEPRGFSFAKEIQPILDKHCIECHRDDTKAPSYHRRDAARKGMDKEQAAKIVAEPILETGSPWHYATEKPPANWRQPSYFKTAEKFPKGEGGFGVMPGKRLKTPWETPDLWMWASIELPEDWSPQPLMLRHFHDENIEIFVNGKRVFGENGFNRDYAHVVLTSRETAAFKPGTNYLAAHVHQEGGGQGADFGFWQLKSDAVEVQRDDRVSASDAPKEAFSLKGTLVRDEEAKRVWSLAYLNLTNANQPNERKPYSGRQTPFVNWLNVQDVPSMLEPYKAGAARSELLKMLDPNLLQDGTTHNDVRLSREELDKIACWIDLLVPYCGDYEEANIWNEIERKKFAYYEKKRNEMAERDKENLVRFVSYRQGNVDAEATPAGAGNGEESQNAYRNLALNPDAVDAVRGETPKSYPVASSNSVCRNAPEFAASNCIDGKTENKGHGAAFPSWGPEQNVEGLYWQVEFGKPVRTDQMAITIRADFPHDTFWKACTIEGSNGFKHRVYLQKTAERQIFRFPPQRVEWIKLTDFESDAPGWAALSEVEILGVDSVPVSYNAPGT